MPTIPLVSTGRAYLLDNNGDYIVAPSTGPNQPLVTRNGPLTSKDRHIVARSTGSAVVSPSSGREVFTRGGTGPLIVG